MRIRAILIQSMVINLEKKHNNNTEQASTLPFCSLLHSTFFDLDSNLPLLLSSPGSSP